MLTKLLYGVKVEQHVAIDVGGNNYFICFVTLSFSTLHIKLKVYWISKVISENGFIVSIETFNESEK